MCEQHILVFPFPMKRHYPNSTKQQYHHMAAIDKPQKAKWIEALMGIPDALLCPPMFVAKIHVETTWQLVGRV